MLPAIYKQMEKLIFTKKMSFAIDHSLLFNCQYGFRSGRKTQDAVVDLIEYVTKKFDDR